MRSLGGTVLQAFAAARLFDVRQGQARSIAARAGSDAIRGRIIKGLVERGVIVPTACSCANDTLS
jgi:hypothetical protein